MRDDGKARAGDGLKTGPWQELRVSAYRLPDPPAGRRPAIRACNLGHRLTSEDSDAPIGGIPKHLEQRP